MFNIKPKPGDSYLEIATTKKRFTVFYDDNMEPAVCLAYWVDDHVETCTMPAEEALDALIAYVTGKTTHV